MSQLLWFHHGLWWGTRRSLSAKALDMDVGMVQMSRYVYDVLPKAAFAPKCHSRLWKLVILTASWLKGWSSKPIFIGKCKLQWCGMLRVRCVLPAPACPAQAWRCASSKRNGAAAVTQMSSFDLPIFSRPINCSTAFSQQRQHFTDINQ